MAYDEMLLMQASSRTTEGYERIEKKLTKIRKILEAELELQLSKRNTSTYDSVEIDNKNNGNH